ncbi:SRS domain-containing protein [Neospora caninum Liverpool]|uniref:SRS domain-containing protein n=1 Tax=Neospora caninum (strain Liverpool) TaxID=572307 RepID=F0VL85_NEOCL|nr:SRS domain-containing protein [Neospora caninum Liverpool]CBZ54837.1 SRS domain-containing protein [Neospora caninum Liverpool]CEL69556.1 TPA: SRS domain-containing protein [Neospora caninum Liverpool]|eukprot:XP_003884865.1 SRS domain-containing protein [Neospora caninum Liverpool]
MSRDWSLVNAFCLAFAMFLACILLDPSLSYASPVLPPSSKEPQTCDTGGSSGVTLAAQLELSLSSEEASVSFKCSSSEKTTLEPQSDQAYTTEQCASPEALSTLFPGSGARLMEQGAAHMKTYTLTVPITARKETKKLCYKCALETAEELNQFNANPQNQGNVCMVKITVNQVEQQEPDTEHTEPNNEQQTDAIQCATPGGTRQASISSESPLSFKCGAGMSLHPTNLTDVFDDQDGKCAAEVGLQTLVDATLTKAETDPPQNEQPVYQLAVKTAPSGDTALCYKCVTTSSNLETKTNTDEASAAKECLLKISVKGSATSACSSAWGVAQTAAAFFVAAHTQLGLF